ncbi:MAG: ParB/RepB/Spo0J family partition protein [Geminicoccaceae bacterium]
MTGRKSRFAIDIADDELGSGSASPSPAPARRGPMASAITDNADSLKERRTLEEKIRRENDELAHQHVRLRGLGLVLELIPLDHIDSEKLTRDRSVTIDLELDDLVISIRELGLSNPIRAEKKDDDRYELIQGYRRLEAYRRLWLETKDDRFTKIPVATVPPGDDLDVSYRKMVDENLVRKDISFAEMAELARAYAKDPATPEFNVDKAVTVLFKATAYQKRSYIRAFAELLESIGDHLKFPQLIPRNLGLDLRRAVDDEIKRTTLIRLLDQAPTRTASEELDLLRQFAVAPGRKDQAEPFTAETKEPKKQRSKHSFAFTAPAQSGHCTAAKGRLELRADCDFSSIETQKIEKAIAAFFEALNQPIS